MDNCPICGKSFSNRTLASHASRCAAQKFADTQRRVPSWMRRAGTKRKERTFSVEPSDRPESLVLTFRLVKDSSADDDDESIANDSDRYDNSEDDTPPSPANEMNGRASTSEIVFDLRGRPSEITVLSGSWQRIASCSVDSKSTSTQFKCILAADERIKTFSESAYVFTKSNGLYDDERNQRWQEMLAQEEIMLQAFKVRQQARKISMSTEELQEKKDDQNKEEPNPNPSSQQLQLSSPAMIGRSSSSSSEDAQLNCEQQENQLNHNDTSEPLQRRSEFQSPERLSEQIPSPIQPPDTQRSKTSDSSSVRPKLSRAYVLRPGDLLRPGHALKLMRARTNFLMTSSLTLPSRF
mmetsp:Transcript_21812/g.33542  ORF Transcript_21812/g.33542 Transcript_21812/m.33542 type:complete len:352 (-) Transcript_21812:4277-5332(-)